MKQDVKRIMAVLFVVVALVGAMPINAFAALIEYIPNIDLNNDGLPDDDYYKVVSKHDWELAPGISETEIVLNNEEGSQRQVVHTVKVDLNNPYAKVIPGYKGMIPTAGNYGVEATSTQAKNAEALGYGNVVAATNAMLSWYTEDYYKQNPQLIGEPLGYNILNGYYYENSRGPLTGCDNVLVINYDKHPISGEPRPDDIPKVTMRPDTSPLTGWEEQAVSVWGWLVKPDANGVPKVVAAKNHTSGFESRTFVGVTANGEVILSVVDGRQAPYSTGFNMYEMGEYMLKMGCIYAANCDGGGSTTFVSERPGEDLKVNCSLSDGGERPTTNTFLVISTAPADGIFTRATIDTDYDYYTPGSSVTFSVLGTDAVGNKANIPSDVTWTIKEEGMGTITNGVFTSNGKEGTVTAQMNYNEEIVGQCSITIATPDKLSFSQSIVTIPYGEKAIIPVKATFGGGLFEIGLSENDLVFTSSNPDVGYVDGLHFVGAEYGSVPNETTTHIVATLRSNSLIKAEVEIKLGEASIVMWDFEDGQADIDEWNAIVLRNPGEPHRDFYHRLSLADRTNGQVHNGNYSMRLETNGLSSKDVHSKQYAYVRLGLKDQKITLENARSIGFWLYVPEDNIQCWVQGYYRYDTNGDGVPDTLAEVNLMNSEYMYYNVDESGWHYLSMDLSNFENVDLTYSEPFDADPSDGLAGDKFEIFFTLIFHKSINNILWQTNGSINGPFTYYIDNITVDYSEVVEDREAPIIESVILHNNGAENNLDKHIVATTTNNLLNATANVTESTYRVDGTGTKHPLTNYTGINSDSIKAYVDGVEVTHTYNNGQISISNIAVADGFHRIKFELCDMAGNKSSVVRLVKVESGVKASTLRLVPADQSLVELDRLNFGSIFWMNMEATNIETIKEVTTVIDLNNVNHWQLDNMILADGFTATYTIDSETNSATITFTRTGKNYQVGKAVLAVIPVRIIYFDTDMKIPGYTAETVWTNYTFWPQDLKIDVDLGKITYVDGFTSEVMGVFSNEKFQVDTEMYTDYQSMGNDPYFTEHKTTHVHTPIEIPDKAATCTQPGYRGRTYCDICKSVVDWGTTIPATSTTGHAYSTVDGIFKCSCGDIFNGVYDDGKKYVEGILCADGWIDESYYINGKILTGVHQIDGKYYNFGDDGICANRYPMSAEYWKNENGEWFYMNVGVPVKGYNNIYPNPSFFDTNTGVAFHGEMVIGGETCIFDRGVFVKSTTADVRLAGLCGPTVYFVLYADGTMILSGEGTTYDYISTGKNFQPVISWKNRPWGNQYAENSLSIKKIYVGKNITSIGAYSFQSCYNIDEIVIEQGSKLREINNHAFHYARNVKSVELPDGVTTLGYSAFGYCGSLLYVKMSELAKSINTNVFLNSNSELKLNVVAGSEAENFAIKNGLNYDTRTSLYGPADVIPGEIVLASGECGANAQWTLYTSGKMVVSGDGAVDGYDSFTKTPWYTYKNNIKSIKIGKDITEIGNWAFASFLNMEHIVFEEGSVLHTLGNYAFHYNQNVKSVELPDVVTRLGYSAFGYCGSLLYVKMSELAKSINPNVFLNSNSELKLNVVAGSEAENFAIKNGLKYETRTSLYGPADVIPGEIVFASGDCGANAQWTLYTSGKMVISGDGAVDGYESFTKTPWYTYKNNIKSIKIGKDITEIGNWAFASFLNMEHIVFEEGSVLHTLGNYAFHYNQKIKSVELPDVVTRLGYSAFGYCGSLLYVKMSELAKSINPNVFLNSNSELKLNVVAGSEAENFAIKNGLKYETRTSLYGPADVIPGEIVLASGDCGANAQWTLYTSGKMVISGDGAVDGYESFTKTPWYTYKNNIKSIKIGKDITEIGNWAFASFLNMEHIVFEEGSVLYTLGNYAFHYNQNVKSVELPDGITRIGYSSLGFCTKLVSVQIPNSVKIINSKAFINHGTGLVLYVIKDSEAEKFAIKYSINYVLI